MRIKILKPGLLSTVQDLGRINFLALGVPFAGAMDKLSMELANLAVGNAENAAVIEFTQGGAAFLTLADCLVAFSGGGAHPVADDMTLPLNKPLFIPGDTEIVLKQGPEGCRLYMAVAGGWNVPEVLGSRSTYLPAKLGGMEGRALARNDKLEALPATTILNKKIQASLHSSGICYPSWQIDAEYFRPAQRFVVRVTPGRERDWFDGDSVRAFFNSRIQTGNHSNRMGLQLSGLLMNRMETAELSSTAVVPGTIQVTNNGEMILLMADAQTTGGYPRIAQVAAVDLPLCAQLRPGDTISFAEISHKEAEQLWFDRQTNLRRLAFAIEQKYS